MNKIDGFFTPDASAFARSYIEYLQTVLQRLDLEEIASFIETLLAARSRGSTVFFIGNGGSAADSQHLAAELVGRYSVDRRPLRSVALTTDSSVLTCIANDVSYDEVFARQTEALVDLGDVLVAISTSGESRNILGALQVAKRKGAGTVALLGKGGGSAGSAADYVLIVDSDSTSRIQEAHILIGHIFCEIVELELNLA